MDYIPLLFSIVVLPWKLLHMHVQELSHADIQLWYAESTSVVLAYLTSSPTSSNCFRHILLLHLFSFSAFSPTTPKPPLFVLVPISPADTEYFEYFLILIFFNFNF